ncbi:MAG: DUF58 domain-containing protein [Massilia sp.]|nr:DUF58 domain-containing protein [Massilia sp.]
MGASSLANWCRRMAGRWLFRLGAHEPGEVFLHRRRVFILPTRAGVGFGAMLLVLLVGATNYQLGLGFALTFLLATCALVDMVLTNRNLARLHLRPVQAASVFAGEDAQFELQLVNRSSLDRYAIGVDFIGADLIGAGAAARTLADVPAGASAALMLSCASTRRGWLRAPRARLATRFPLGLFRAWGYWQPDLRALVYPFPEAVAAPLPAASGARADGRGGAGHDDFAGIRSYQAGDALRSLAWRQIARLDAADGGQLVTKHFEGGAVEQLLLDYDALPAGMDVELRLSRLTRWVLDAEQRAQPYALRLGGQAFDAGIGVAHLSACLRALALHELEGEAP